MELHQRLTNDIFNYLKDNKVETEELNEFKTLLSSFTDLLIKSIHETFIDIPKETMKKSSEDQIAKTLLEDFKHKKRFEYYEPIIRFLAEKLVYQDKVQQALGYIAKLEDILIEFSLKAQTKELVEKQVGRKWE